MATGLEWMRDGSRLILRGELENETLLPLWAARAEAIQDISVLDLSALSRVDTGGLALIVHLYALAHAGGNPVQITGISDKLCGLAQLYNLPDDLLPGFNA